MDGDAAGEDDAASKLDITDAFADGEDDEEDDEEDDGRPKSTFTTSIPPPPVKLPMSNSVEPTAVGELHEGADEEEPVLLLPPVKASNDNGVVPDNGEEEEDNGEDTGEDSGGEGDGAVSELRSSDVGGVNPPPVSEEDVDVDVDVDGVVVLVGDIGGVDEANNAALVPFPLKSTVLMSLLFSVLLLLLPPPIKSLAPFSKASTILLKDDWVGEGGDVEEEVDEVDEVSREEGAVSKVIPSVLALSRNWLNSFLRASL